MSSIPAAPSPAAQLPEKVVRVETVFNTSSLPAGDVVCIQVVPEKPSKVIDLEQTYAQATEKAIAEIRAIFGKNHDIMPDKIYRYKTYYYAELPPLPEEKVEIKASQ
jgi:hypothetical protein